MDDLQTPRPAPAADPAQQQCTWVDRARIHEGKVIRPMSLALIESDIKAIEAEIEATGEQTQDQKEALVLLQGYLRQIRGEQERAWARSVRSG
ncbi:hypothetical protein KBI52_15725 [Microvirga sp. HBU67558]|uniref:hypothetical protein n=1 Tax=Microvirga TaxID=186650 RepID=UPI001B38B64C|nr:MULTISPECIES: hypothetical protein [unclassified Microvirga]MBQ0821642.1 hypothetical protein [Microvirga sp. HBU67558]